MKSLQVLSPARKCIFNCPFCIAKTHEHHNAFENNYQNNHAFWKTNYIDILNNNRDLKTVVITGTNEPMQDPDYVEEVIKLTRETNPNIKIELQTRHYSKKPIYEELDVIAYSIDDYKMLSKINIINEKTRYVIILTSSFNDKGLSDILKEIPKSVRQITFKILHDSKGINFTIDNWIKENKTSLVTVNKLKEDINNYQGNISIIFDENCMDSDNRYMVFREDGLLYSDFDSKNSY